MVVQFVDWHIHRLMYQESLNALQALARFPRRMHIVRSVRSLAGRDFNIRCNDVVTRARIVSVVSDAAEAQVR